MKKRQCGSALIVGLVFLLILTILGAAGMKMARIQILLSGNDQFLAQASNATEAAVEKQLQQGNFSLEFTVPSNPVSADVGGGVSGTSTIQYLNQGMAPDGGFSDDVMTYRFLIEAKGQAPAGAQARANVEMRQGFYVLAPGGN